MATIILPSESSSSDLQTAINGAVSGDIVELSSNMNFSEMVSIQTGLSVTVQSKAGNQWTMLMTISGIRHFVVSGTLILNNIIVNGNSLGEISPPITQGGIQVTEGTLTLLNGAVKGRCGAHNGGAVSAVGGTVNVQGGSITNNNAQLNGGGVYADEALVSITSGEVTDNEANSNGGGIALYNVSTCNITDFQRTKILGGRLLPPA